MSLIAEFRRARREEGLARVRRILALRAMLATGMRQHAIAAALGISQPAVSQQAKADVGSVSAETLIEAAGPVLAQIAAQRGFSKVAVFGSVARGQSRPDSDVDILVQPPAGATIDDLLDLQEIFEQTLGRQVDVVTYGALKPGIDDDVLRDAALL